MIFKVDLRMKQLVWRKINIICQQQSMQFSRKPTTLKAQTVFTREEVVTTDCCFTLFPQHKNTSNQTQQYRSHSEPRKKKIDLVIAKRGQSLSKYGGREGGLLTTKKAYSVSELKSMESVTGHSSLTSKLTTQKNSLRNSRTKVTNEDTNQHLTLTNRYSKFIDVAQEAQSRQMEVTFSQNRADMVNGSIQMLSEISMVEEEFMSHGSATLKALNMLTAQTDRKNNDKGSPVPRFTLDVIPERRAEDGRDVKNPLQRLLQKKRLGKTDVERPKLHL